MPLVTFPSPAIEFIVGPQVTSNSEPLAQWYDEVSQRRGIYWAEKMLAMAEPVVSFNHYDLIACLYILFYRTGNTIYLSYARRVADKWFKSEYLQGGLPVGGGSKPAPMHVGVVGLTLYALDGHPEVFGYLDRRFREEVDIRLLGKLTAPDIYGDMRDDGYIFYAAVLLGNFLPDNFPQIIWDNDLNVSTVQVTNGAERRAKYKEDAKRAAIEYFGRLQETDGGWRWRLWNPEEAIKEQLARLGIEKLEQPFMLGIYLEAAILLHRTTTDLTLKANLKNQIVKATEHLYRDCYKQTMESVLRCQVPNNPYMPIVSGVVGGTCTWAGATGKIIQNWLTSIPRATLYFYPKELNVDYQGSDRHLTATQISAFGYAYQLTGDAKFIQMGDELWDSCFPPNGVGDGNKAMMDSDADTHLLKLFTAEYRSSGKYLAWRAGAPDPDPGPIDPPPPPPVTTRKVPWPSGEAKQNAIVEAQWKERYRFKRHLSGAYAEFEKIVQ